MRICHRWIQEKTMDQWDQSHPPRCTTSRYDRLIVRMAVMDLAVTSQNMAQRINSIAYHFVSAHTIRRRLRHVRMIFIASFARLFLTILPFFGSQDAFVGLHHRFSMWAITPPCGSVRISGGQ
ncbi:hypothetical protein TNCV_3812181 [Trichonephila clavipes]|nr:hypothetical protein TNCV_3812181 [Trichonephila clavipes]